MDHSYHLRAILAALCAYALWVLCDASNKLAAQAGLPVAEITCIVGTSGLLTIIVVAAGMGIVSKLRPRKWGEVLLASFLAALSTVCNVVAVKYLPLALFYACVFSAPLVTALLAVVLINENLGVRGAVAIIIGFVGVVVAIDPSFDKAGDEAVGYAAIVASVVCVAFSWILLRRVTQSESLWSITAVFYGIMASMGLVLLGSGPINLH